MRQSFTLTVNGKAATVDVEPDTPLLYVLRDELGLTGSKYGCGAGLCGACSVLIAEETTRSCSLPVSQVAGRPVTTIEGIAATRFAPIQEAWLSHQVVQCGYCQPGMIISAAGLIARDATPSPDTIAAEISNICRCGTYQRIPQAIAAAASTIRQAGRRT